MGGLYEQGVVLIVDDNEIVREIVHTVCKRIGFMRVVEAQNGADAWDEIQKAAGKGQEVRLIISDIDMPTMNGLEFLNRVRNNAKVKDMPFLLLTAHAERELVLEAAKIGVTTYITKPFAMSSIEKKIRETLELQNHLH